MGSPFRLDQSGSTVRGGGSLPARVAFPGSPPDLCPSCALAGVAHCRPFMGHSSSPLHLQRHLVGREEQRLWGCTDSVHSPLGTATAGDLGQVIESWLEPQFLHFWLMLTKLFWGACEASRDMQVGARCGSQREVGTGWGVGPWGDSPLRAAAVSWTSGLILCGLGWSHAVTSGSGTRCLPPWPSSAPLPEESSLFLARFSALTVLPAPRWLTATPGPACPSVLPAALFPLAAPSLLASRAPTWSSAPSPPARTPLSRPHPSLGDFPPLGLPPSLVSASTMAPIRPDYSAAFLHPFFLPDCE